MIKLTNVKCNDYDKSFLEYKNCELKVLKRSIIALNVYVKLHQVPVYNVTVNMSLWKRASGYRPFMYNITANFCEFMAHRTRYPFMKIFLDFVMKSSNLNHTCPYEHDIIIHNLVVKDEYLRLLPLPTGEYRLDFKINAFNIHKADFIIFIRTVENDK
ncbi:uncharacterized protein LOC119685087 [Teleopsis dalmanni]|uniref:uncharacterized protein LOC119685087 n=1 Tax=Teleopsis dalmanni TaxID=139649 RepID=UPI0018CFB51B|nr:uncharacterized protein LOC119685087 [Teleopsis dalmanni]